MEASVRFATQSEVARSASAEVTHWESSQLQPKPTRSGVAHRLLFHVTAHDGPRS